MLNARISPNGTALDEQNLFGYCNATARGSVLTSYNYSWYKGGVVDNSGVFYGTGSISAGTSYTCGIRSSDSRVLCWGSNTYGRLGIGTNTNQSVPNPMLINDSSAYKMVDSGYYHTCGIRRNDSRVLCWGRNNNGELGVALVLPYYYNSPVLIS